VSNLVDQILGRRVAESGDVPPVLAGKPRRPLPLRIQPPKDKNDDKLRAKARQSSVVASIIGMTESDDESIIPSEAKLVDTTLGGETIPGVRNDPLPSAEGPAEPQFMANVDGAELIQPTAALVAPDVTPNVMKQIDPSQVPAPPKSIERPTPPPSVAAAQQMGHQTMSAGARGAMDTILGRQNPAPEELETMAESVVAAMNVNPAEITVKVAEALTPAQPGTSLMPDHKESDGKTVYSAFRRFM